MSLDFPRPPAWTEFANCATSDTEAFFPTDRELVAAARAICSRCTVTAECLDYSLEHNDQFGVYGGMSVKERNRIRIQRAKDAA